MSDIEGKINTIVNEVSDVKINVASLNGKVDNLTNLMGSKWENVEERFRFTERSVEQGFKAISERINFEVQRSDEAHRDIRNDITEIKTQELEPIKTEVESSKTFRNRLIGIAVGVSLVSGGTAGVLAKMITEAK